METTAVFDFHQPWIALVQIALMFVLPTLVGLVTDKLSASGLKVALLGGLTLATTLLTSLLDSLLSGTQYDWLNMLLNGVITWALGIAAYIGILKPVGAIEKVQENTSIQLFGPSPARLAALAPAKVAPKRKVA
jgi:hypothetical protein